MLIIKMVFCAYFLSFIQLWFTHHKIQPLKLNNSMILYIQNCATIITEFQNICITPQRNLLVVTPHSSLPSPWQTLIYFLSPHICLFWTCQINRILQYVAFLFGIFHLAHFQGSSTLKHTVYQYSISIYDTIITV